MIKDFFGLTTGNFIKVYILIAFLFFFLRLVHLSINFVKGDSKLELKRLFYGTEFILWALLLLWIYYSIPSQKTIFLALSIAFAGLNTAIWFGVRQRIAGVIFIRVYKVSENYKLKINNEIYRINKLFLNNFDAQKNDELIKFKYIQVIKQKIETPKTTKFSVQITENSDFKTQNKLEEALIENNFMSENSIVQIEKDESDKLIWLIKVTTFDIEKNKEIEEFIREIM